MPLEAASAAGGPVPARSPAGAQAARSAAGRGAAGHGRGMAGRGAEPGGALPSRGWLGSERLGAARQPPARSPRGGDGWGPGRAGLGEGLCRPPALKCESEPKSEPRGKGGGGGWEPPAAARPRSPCTDAEAHTHTLPNANSPLRFCRGGGQGERLPQDGVGEPPSLGNGSPFPLLCRLS